ncbi:MAG: PIN domain-containing protein [Gemmatimonadetes bacterium]|nr:PIN domain-containing protein [Gemmatimonadota bacterium]
MTLCDTGPLVALVDEADAHHARCASALGRLPPVPLLTTWPCFTEAMYLLGRRGGLRPQGELWSFVATGLVTLDAPAAGEWERMRDLMAMYEDLPMHLADASPVSAAERLGIERVFTLDRHFHAYRIQGRDAFQVIP